MTHVVANDPLWAIIQSEIRHATASEPATAAMMTDAILRHPTLEDALAFLLAGKLASPLFPISNLSPLLLEALNASGDIRLSIREDLNAISERDPAAENRAIPFLFFKGFHALQTYRIAHWFWAQERHLVAEAVPGVEEKGGDEVGHEPVHPGGAERE